MAGWNCNTQGCPKVSNSVCSPEPAFPRPCAAMLVELTLALVVLGCIMQLGCCICVFKRKLNKWGLVVSALGAIGIAVLLHYMSGAVSGACVAVGILHQSGYDVPTVPPGWDAAKPTELSEIDNFEMQKCVCRKGSFALGTSKGGECVDPENYCPKLTGGTCGFLGCDSSRNAKCQELRLGYKRCVCHENACAKHGVCVPMDEYKPPDGYTAPPTDLGSFSKTHQQRTNFTESIAATQRGGTGSSSLVALSWIAAVVLMAVALTSAAVASGRARGLGREPLLAER